MSDCLLCPMPMNYEMLTTQTEVVMLNWNANSYYGSAKAYLSNIPSTATNIAIKAPALTVWTHMYTDNDRWANEECDFTSTWTLNAYGSESYGPVYYNIVNFNNDSGPSADLNMIFTETSFNVQVQPNTTSSSIYLYLRTFERYSGTFNAYFKNAGSASITVTYSF